MKRLMILVVFALPLASCCPKRVAVGSSSTDSVRVVRETEYIERWRDTTIYIQLPAEVKEVVGEDSSSLETSAARSEARIMPDGRLFHTLSNKDRLVGIGVGIKDTEKITRDTTQIKQYERVDVPVEKELSRLQKFFIYSGVALWGLVLLYLVFKFVKIR